MKSKGNARNTLIGVCKVCLLLLFVGYYASVTLFYHSHLVNGHIVVHSHPFRHASNPVAPFENHSHSNKAYLFYEHMGSIHCEEALLALPELSAYLRFLGCVDSPYLFGFLQSDRFLLHSRGPPVFFCF